ncbi:hypothetical protein LCGC14_2274970, partial [marine sediment metagenome]
ALRAVQLRIAIAGLMVALLAALIGLLVSRRISRPLEQLKRGAEQFARGDLSGKLAVGHSQEIASLAETMNQMAAELDKRIRAAVGQRNQREAILSSMVEGVLAVDSQQRLISLNRAGSRLLGVEPYALAKEIPEWFVALADQPPPLATKAEAEAAGDLRLGHHDNQAMPYAHELTDPAADGEPVTRDKLWVFMSSQETTLVSPAMFDEFMLGYQMPIMAKFGLVSYGCCEDLTRKIDLLKKVPNMRRISVTPWADVAKCAEQIGTDYVMSWRPSPSEMICRGFDPDRVRKLVREGLDAARPCHVDVTLKDVETIGGNFDNLIEWTRIVRDIVEDYA